MNIKKTFSSCRNKGFTLIEVLVASLLLGMLVSILTMVFNQTSIAWRTGKAGVAALSQIRYDLSRVQYFADNALPRIKTDGTSGYITSAWRRGGGQKKLVERGVAELPGNVGSLLNVTWSSKDYYLNRPAWSRPNVSGSYRFDSENTYTIGVLSYGPDGEIDTEDDICSWPDEVE